MSLFVIVSQFFGLFLVFLIFPVYVLPFFEERFEARLPRQLPTEGRYVLIYRYGPAVTSLIEELQRHQQKVVVLEEDQAQARRLDSRGLEVVNAAIGEEDIAIGRVRQADAVVVNGPDPDNATFILMLREAGYRGPIYALAEHPLHRVPMMKSGATAVYTPAHVLAAALAAKASDRTRSRLSGVQQLGEQLGLAELRIHADSPLAGQTLAEARLRERIGAAVIGQWVEGEFQPVTGPATRLMTSAILVAIGSPASLERLATLAHPLPASGPVVIAGFGDVGQKVVELLSDDGVFTTVIDLEMRPGVDVVGSVLDQSVLETAGVRRASAVVLALNNDSTSLFAAAMVRDYNPEVPVIASVKHASSVDRLYRVGADFAISLGDVSGRILAFHILGEEYLSIEPGVKLVRLPAGLLAGQHPLRAEQPIQAGCQVVAIGRGDSVVVDFPREFRIEPGDEVYIVGTPERVDRLGQQLRGGTEPAAGPVVA
ncbi:MAG: hypothetical protein D6786_05000 [Gammaproteobacteria bacterium]|nr:MAG: hypothetical protein D6786_05000 [Gammaproteobacteria bacterium]